MVLFIIHIAAAGHRYLFLHNSAFAIGNISCWGELYWVQAKQESQTSVWTIFSCCTEQQVIWKLSLL